MKKSTFTALALATALFAGQALAEEGKEGKGPHGGPGGHHHKFQDSDTNKDGTISREEFHARGDKMFSKLDSNSDGKIDQAEREAKHKQWQEKRAEWKAKREAMKANEGAKPAAAKTE